MNHGIRGGHPQQQTHLPLDEHVHHAALACAADPQGQAQAWLWLAEDYAKRHVAKAIALYQRAAGTAPPGHPLWLAAQLGMAELWSEAAALPEMEACLGRTLAAAPALPPADQAKAHLLFANAALLRRQWDRALADARAALLLWQAQGNLYDQARALAIASEITAQQGNVERALVQAEHCFDLWAASGHPDGPLRRLRTESAVCLAAGLAEAACASLQQALALAQETGGKVQSFAIHRAGVLARIALGQAADAAREWLAAWELGRQLGGGALLDGLRRLQTDEPLLGGILVPEDTARIDQLAADLARGQGRISAHSLANEAGVSPSTAIRAINRLCGQGALERIGQGRNTRYRLARPTGGDDGQQLVPPDELEVLILVLIARKQQISLQDVLEHGDVSRATAQRGLARLVAAGRLLRRGKGRSVVYVLPGAAGTVPRAKFCP